jgi:glyoxylase-like metal-dependent hydrolase (beta-lactamase superfamily II)
MGYYTVKKIYPWLYSIFDPLSVYCYLVVGDEKALLFDTTYGIGSLPDVIREVTDKPVVTVLGHGHVDHANGAYQFNDVWLHEGDFELFHQHTSEEIRRSTLSGLAENKLTLPEGFDPETYVKAGTGNLKKLPIGQVFDLGGLHLEVVAMEGHTSGSVGLLVQEHRILLDSDAANQHIWMFIKEALPINQYITMLERVIKLDFDTFFTGHSDMPRPKSDFQKYINVARNIKTEKSTPYGMFPELKGLLYSEGDAEIVYSEEKLK